MAGYQITGANIQNRCGDVAASTFRALAEVRKVKAWLDTVTAADLETVYGLPASDAATLKSAYTDLAALADVFDGTGIRAIAYDHRTFTGRLYGVGQY